MDTRTKEGEQVRSGYEANCNQGSILKNEATIALPRHDGKMKKKNFSPFVLVLITLLHSVRLSKLSLSQ